MFVLCLTLHSACQEGGSKEAYLGLLSPHDEYLVYGYVTCTRVKFLLAFDNSVRGEGEPGGWAGRQ